MLRKGSYYRVVLCSKLIDNFCGHLVSWWDIETDEIRIALYKKKAFSLVSGKVAFEPYDTSSFW